VLGKNYVVWDKGASMKFVKPIIDKVKCRFLISNELVADVKSQVELRGEYSFDLPLHYEDDNGKVYATFSKSVYVASKEVYKKKLADKAKKNLS
jgi:hypothetical protein